MAKLNRVSIPLLTILLLAVFSSVTVSQQGTAPATTSKLLQLTIQAPSLKGNLLGDPTEQPVYVYLPPGYEGSTRRYPTLYLLHGFTANSSIWINGQYQGMRLQTLMDDSIKSGTVREMIVVSANGSNAYKGSFYTNSVVTTVGAALRGRPRLNNGIKNRQPRVWRTQFQPRAATEGRPYSTFRSSASILASALPTNRDS